MAWKISYSKSAQKDLARIDKTQQVRIIRYLEGMREDPRSQGKALKGSLEGYWRYRVGDYRVICDLQDTCRIILVIKVGNRGDIY